MKSFWWTGAVFSQQIPLRWLQAHLFHHLSKHSNQDILNIKCPSLSYGWFNSDFHWREVRPWQPTFLPVCLFPLGALQDSKLSIIKGPARGLGLKHIRVTWAWHVAGHRTSGGKMGIPNEKVTCAFCRRFFQLKLLTFFTGNPQGFSQSQQQLWWMAG